MTWDLFLPSCSHCNAVQFLGFNDSCDLRAAKSRSVEIIAACFVWVINPDTHLVPSLWCAHVLLLSNTDVTWSCAYVTVTLQYNASCQLSYYEAFPPRLSRDALAVTLCCVRLCFRPDSVYVYEVVAASIELNTIHVVHERKCESDFFCLHKHPTCDVLCVNNGHACFAFWRARWSSCCNCAIITSFSPRAYSKGGE